MDSKSIRRESIAGSNPVIRTQLEFILAYQDDKKREYQRDWLARRRNKAIEILGGSCASCGSDASLEFDHIDPTEKDPWLKPSSGKMWSRSWTYILSEIDKCQLLCTRCHKAKTRDDRPDLLHGSKSMYEKRNCKCDKCRFGNAERQRAKRARIPQQ